MTKKIRQDIQILRGIAVLGVILFHINPSFFHKGYLGVDIFFVISGFLLMPIIARIFSPPHSIRTQIQELFRFFTNRIFRLAPAAGVNIIFTLLLMIFIGLPSDFVRFLKQAFFTLFLLGNIGAYRFSGDYFHPDSNPLLHTWSLAVEEQFYLLVPVIFLITSLALRYFHLRIASISIVFMFSISLTLFLFPSLEIDLLHNINTNIGQSFLYYSTISRIWEFLLGGITALYGNEILHSFRGKNPISNFISPIIVLISVFCIYALSTDKVIFQILAINYLTCVAIGAKLLSGSSRFTILIWLGNRSYSLYLFHFPLIYIFQHSQLFGILHSKNYISIPLCLIALVVLSNLSFVYVEEKFRNSYKDFRSTLIILIRFSISPMILVLIAWLSIVPIQKFLVHQPPMVEFGGRMANPPLGFMDKNCAAHITNNVPCYIGKKSNSKTLVLIGDSHAEQYVETLARITKDRSWNLAIWTQHGCRFVLSPSKVFRYDQSCLESNQKIFTWLKQNRPDGVVISQMLYPTEDLSKVSEAILSIEEIVPRLLVIGNNPVFPDANDFMRARPILAGTYQAPKSFLLDALDLNYNTISNKLLTELQNVGIANINPFEHFCKLGKCVRWKNGHWLYIDDGHLSVYGARLFESDISIFLK